MKRSLLLLIVCTALTACAQQPVPLSDPSENPNQVSVSNFEECIAQTDVVMESYPRQCRFEDMVFVEDLEEGDSLLVLDSKHPACTKIPADGGSDGIGREVKEYPVADDYQLSGDDYHRIAGLFTAAACGDGRLNELFGDTTFEDVVLFTNKNQDSSLVSYLKEEGFTCNDTTSDENCSAWYYAELVPLDVLVGLRQWAEMFTGSDCLVCG